MYQKRRKKNEKNEKEVDLFRRLEHSGDLVGEKKFGRKNSSKVNIFFRNSEFSNIYYFLRQILRVDNFRRLKNVVYKQQVFLGKRLKVKFRTNLFSVFFFNLPRKKGYAPRCFLSMIRKTGLCVIRPLSDGRKISFLFCLFINIYSKTSFLMIIEVAMVKH